MAFNIICRSNFMTWAWISQKPKFVLRRSQIIWCFRICRSSKRPNRFVSARKKKIKEHSLGVLSSLFQQNFAFIHLKSNKVEFDFWPLWVIVSSSSKTKGIWYPVSKTFQGVFELGASFLDIWKRFEKRNNNIQKIEKYGKWRWRESDSCRSEHKIEADFSGRWRRRQGEAGTKCGSHQWNRAHNGNYDR